MTNTWRQSAQKYITGYKLHRMQSLTFAPASIRLHYRVTRKNNIPFRLADLGYFDPKSILPLDKSLRMD